MGRTENLPQSELNEDWEKLFEAMRIGVIVIEKEQLRIKSCNKSAEEIFKGKLEVGSSIANISHELINDKLIADIRKIFKDPIPIKELVLTKQSRWFEQKVELCNSCDREEAIYSFVDVTDLKVELENKLGAEKKLQREILEVEEKERWRLGQHLHDSTAQNLMAIKMLMDLIEPQLQQLDEETKSELKKIKRLIIKSEKNIRELSHFILPIEIEGKILDAFKELITQTEEIYNIECNFVAEGDIDLIKDPASASSVYYISQEAIRNAIHHGQAERVEVVLSTDDESLFLTVEDNGMGYKKSDKGKGMGINIMKHRAELLGGSLRIKKTRHGGTMVKCVIPLDRIRKQRT